MYAVEYSMAPSEEKEDQAVLSTVYTTVSYCLHREEGDKEETKKEWDHYSAICETVHRRNAHKLNGPKNLNVL